jgi:hypothetical protein
MSDLLEQLRYVATSSNGYGELAERCIAEIECFGAKLTAERERYDRMIETHSRTTHSFELYANVREGQSLHDRIGELLDIEVALKGLRLAYLRKNGCYPLPHSDGYAEMQAADEATRQCNCAGVAPTMPVYRTEHLPTCPLKNNS